MATAACQQAKPARSRSVGFLPRSAADSAYYSSAVPGLETSGFRVVVRHTFLQVEFCPETYEHQPCQPNSLDAKLRVGKVDNLVDHAGSDHTTEVPDEDSVDGSDNLSQTAALEMACELQEGQQARDGMSDDDIVSGLSASDADCAAPEEISLNEEAKDTATSAFSVHSESFYPASYWQEWSYGAAYGDYSCYGVSGFWEQEQKEQQWHSLAQEQKVQEQKEQQWYSLSEQWQHPSQQWAYDPVGCAGKAAGAEKCDKTAISDNAASHAPVTKPTCTLASGKSHAHAYAAALAAARQPARQSAPRLQKPSARSNASSSSASSARPKRWQVKTDATPPCTSVSGLRWADLED